MSGLGPRLLAHTGHVSHEIHPAIPAAVFVAGLLFLGAGVYLLRRQDVDVTYANAGLGLGVLGILGSIALAVL